MRRILHETAADKGLEIICLTIHADHDDEKIKWARGYYAGTAGHTSSETEQDYTQLHEEDEQ